MQLLELEEVGRNYEYTWPGGPEKYTRWLQYRASASDGHEHRVRIGYGKREVYGSERVRLVVWIDGHPSAEFFGADDFESTGDLLSEIRVAGEVGEVMCRYPDDAVPERYVMFSPTGLRTRVRGSGVHNAWAVIANVGDHHRMAALAALRNLERIRFGYGAS